MADPTRYEFESSQDDPELLTIDLLWKVLTWGRHEPETRHRIVRWLSDRVESEAPR